jgi:hypothetical protein
MAVTKTESTRNQQMNAMTKYGTQKASTIISLNKDVWQTEDSCLQGCGTM